MSKSYVLFRQSQSSMKSVFFVSVLLVALIISVIILSFIIMQPLKEKGVSVSFSGKNITITAEVADTPYMQEKGLMVRQSLPDGNGMFFIFENQGNLRFWMKNTLIPLDMLFISENFTIVNISGNAQPCISDPCRIYSSVIPAKYVLEVNAGFAEKNGIKIGDKIRIG